ncbi:MAG: hypothetical protein M3340_12105 [Actinomycetota bacterium]|nr:hypothetical protein [Actinomycetota bacterium]
MIGLLCTYSPTELEAIRLVQRRYRAIRVTPLDDGALLIEGLDGIDATNVLCEIRTGAAT